MADRIEGTVKWFSFDKGYGFVSGSDGEEYFIHHSQAEGLKLEEGTEITFEAVESDKGKQAHKVQLKE